MAKSKFEYRAKATSFCPYLLETTPEPHFVSATHIIIETVLINRFGKKNIPLGNFWRLADTSKQVYGAQKYLWPIVKRLEKTYDGAIVLSMVRRKTLKYLTNKLYGRYLYWCKEEKDLEKSTEAAESRYYKSREELEDKPVIDIEQKKDDDLLDWLD